MARLPPKCRLPVRAAEVCTSLPAEGNAATREHFTSELLFTPLALKDRCHNSSITYKQSLALHPGGKFLNLQIGQVTDKLYNSDAKPPISGPALVKKGGEEGLQLLRNPAHCWERRWRERSEGFTLYSCTCVCFCQRWAGRKFPLPKMPLSCLSQGYLSQHGIPRQRFLQLSENKMVAKKASPAQYILFQHRFIFPSDHHSLSVPSTLLLC